MEIGPGNEVSCFPHSSLRKARMVNIDFEDARLHSADLTGANLVGAKFRRAKRLDGVVDPSRSGQ